MHEHVTLWTIHTPAADVVCSLEQIAEDLFDLRVDSPAIHLDESFTATREILDRADDLKEKLEHKLLGKT